MLLERTTLASHDVNNDGKISFLEWALKDDLTPTVSLDLLAKRWLQYDVEGKGYLTVDEAYHRRN